MLPYGAEGMKPITFELDKVSGYRTGQIYKYTTKRALIISCNDYKNVPKVENTTSFCDLDGTIQNGIDAVKRLKKLSFSDSEITHL